jgi:ADP-heptose:LPS heptosyltransferase
MRRIVLSRPDRLGDVIITSSLLPILRTAWPDCEFHWLVARPFHPLFVDHPYLAGLITREAAPERLVALRPEAILHFQPDSALASLTAACGIPQRVGYREKWWTRWLTAAIPDDRPLGLQHEARYGLELASQLFPVATPATPFKPCLSLSPASRDSLLQKLPAGINLVEYVAINPTAYSDYLRWPWESFMEVCRWLVQEQSLIPILISGEPQDPSVLALAQAMSSEKLPCLNLAGKLDLAELAWLLSGVKLHLARNTGTSHLAAAVDCPQVELFIRHQGRYSPTRWRSLSSRSIPIVPEVAQSLLEPNPAYWSRCAQSISAEKVCRQIQNALSL